MAIVYDSTADEIQFSGKPRYIEFDLLATSTDASVAFADGHQFKITKDIRLLATNSPGVLWSRNALANKSWSSSQTLYIKVDGGEWQGVVFAAGTSYTPATIATLINSSTNGLTATANVGTKGTYISIKSDYDFTQSSPDPADSWVEINSTEAVREYFGWEDYERETGNAGCDLSEFGNCIINPNAKQIWIDDGVVDAKWRDVTFIESGDRLSATRKLFQGSDENSGNDNTRYIAEGGGYCHSPEGGAASGNTRKVTRIDIESVSNVRLWANEIAVLELNEVLVRKSSELNGITAAPRVQSIGVDGRNAAGQGGHIRARFRDLKCSSALGRNGTKLNAFWGASVMFEGLENEALNPLADDIRWFNSYRGSGTTDQYVYFLGTAEAFARARSYSSNDIQNRVTYLHLVGGAIHYHKVTDGEGGVARYYDSRQTGPARHIPTLNNTEMLLQDTTQEIGSDEQIQVVIQSWTVDVDSTPAWSRDDITNQRLVITKYEKNIISFDIDNPRENIGRHDNFAPLPMTDDTSITEMTKATVSAYSELDSAAKMYDWLKLILMNYFDNYGDGNELFCTRSESTIDFGSRDVQIMNRSADTINTIRSDSSELQFTVTGSRSVAVGDIVYVSGTTSYNGLHRVKGLTGTLAFETDGTFSANENGGSVLILFRPIALTASSGTMQIHTGADFAGSVESTGTITVDSNVTVSGTVKDSSGVSVLFTGLPAGANGVVAAWPSAQGTDNRANVISGQVADDTATTIKLTLALDTSYHFVMDALGYRRSSVGTIDTTSQLQATAAVQLIVNPTGTRLIPTSLTTDEQAEADLITWSADFVDVAADEVGEVTPAVGASMTGTETENFDVDGLNLRVVSQTFGTGGSITGQTTNTIFSGNGRTAAQIVTSLNTSFNFANSGVTASVSNGAVVLTRDDAGVAYGFYIHDNSTAASVLGFVTGSANGVVGVDLIPAPRSPIDATPSFNSLSYEIERGQSTEAAQSSLLYPARIESGRIIFPASSGQKWRRKEGDVHVPDIEAISIGKDGSADAGDFIDFSNGGLKYKTEPPVNIVLSGGSLLSQSDFDTRMSGVADTIKDTYKADVSGIPTDNNLNQSDFDAKMLAVPDTTKDTYKGSGGGEGGGTISQTDFNTRMANVPDATKNTYKADVSAIPTDNPSASDIVDAIESSTDGNGLTAIRSAITTVDSVADSIKTVVDTLPTDNNLDQSDFDAKMLAVPETTKDGYKGSGGGEGGGTISQTDFNTRMANVPDATKNTYKADVSAIPTDNPSVADIVAGVEASATDTAVDAIKTVVDGIQTDLNNTTDGLGALLTAINNISVSASISQSDFDALMLAVPGTTKDTYKGTGGDSGTSITQTAFNTLMSDLPDATKNTFKADVSGLDTSGIATIDTVVDSIKSSIEDTTNGLSAIKTAIGNLNNLSSSDIASAVEGSATDTAVDSIKTAIDDTTNGLAAIVTAIGNLNNLASSDVVSAVEGSAVKTVIDQVKTLLENSTYGLSAIQSDIADLPTDSSPTANDIRDAVFDKSLATGVDFTKALELMMAVLFGRTTISGSTVSFRNISNDIVCRVSVGEDGIRTTFELVE